MTLSQDERNHYEQLAENELQARGYSAGVTWLLVRYIINTLLNVSNLRARIVLLENIITLLDNYLLEYKKEIGDISGL